MSSFHLPFLTPAPLRAVLCFRGPIPVSGKEAGCEAVVAGGMRRQAWEPWHFKEHL